MQGQEFETEVYVLPLAGYEMILGMPWLSSLGTIHWNFEQLIMKFEWAGKSCTLNGNLEALRVVEANELTKMLVQEPASLVQCWMIKAMVVQEEERKTQLLHPKLQDLLEEFYELFEEPHGLPPHREQNHKIPLQENHRVINLRLYRYAAA